MKIFCAYTNPSDATLISLQPYIDQSTFIDCSDDKWAYVKHFRRRWSKGEGFINVEHDICFWPGAIERILCGMNCSIENCARPVLSRGWCSLHYQRWQRHGDPLAGKTFKPRGLNLEEAFAWFMPGDPPPADECWDWTGGLAAGRYGTFRFSGGNVLAHVASHRIYNTNDPVTEEKPFVLHSCDRPICCQPAHLHADTQANNVLEAVERNRHTHGEHHHRARLKEPDVLFIRQSPLSNVALANMFGVHKETVGCIRRRKSWKHLP